MANAQVFDNVEETADVAADATAVHRTVLLLGKTGNGKSTLGNVIVGGHSQDPPQEIFEEGEFMESMTQKASEYIANIQGRQYRIVDTVGIGDTGMKEEAVLMKLARTCHWLRHGINQILFVLGGKFTKEEVEAVTILRQVLFDENICSFLTIVRTKANFFENPDKCAEEIRRAKGNGSCGRDIFERAAKIIHVNNPGNGDRDDWAEVRAKSRARVLARIERCGELYKPPKLTKISDNIKKHVEARERLENEIKELTEKLKAMERKGEANEGQLTTLRTQIETEQTNHKMETDALREQLNATKAKLDETKAEEMTTIKATMLSNAESFAQKLVDAQTQTGIKEAELQIAQTTIEALRIQLEEAQKEQNRLIEKRKEADETARKEYEKYFVALTAQMARADQEADRATSAEKNADYYRGRADVLAEDAKTQRERYEKLKGRGWWSRLRNKDVP